jgi:hypothetical protein
MNWVRAASFEKDRFMPKLTPEQRFQNARERMLEIAKQYQTGTYIRKFVAPEFQRMIRAEAAALPEGLTVVIINGELGQSYREVGQIACVTCGTVKAWDSGIKGMHTAHFLGSRCNSIIFEEDNVAPGCSYCNYYRSGEQQLFRKWMLSVRGVECVERLERLKPTSRNFTREELVDMRIAYKNRLDKAIATMLK